ncbi:MAG: transketolase [Nanoarchaeota archaeon]|nr:transketolase [Nanoarchaeota archaeon]
MSQINDNITLGELVSKVRRDVIHSTTLANSGHPGGPLGFAEALLLGLDSLNLDPEEPFDPSKDKLVVSAGHYSAGVYSAIANLFFPEKSDLVVSNFRSLKDVVEGHVTHHFPFIWDSTGHLGYGPAIAAGHALADRLLGYNDTHILCTMGDGEQTKGPIAESLRFIRKYKLDNITLVVDVNEQQLSGPTNEVMPMDIRGNFGVNDWQVIDVDGYNMESIRSALKEGRNAGSNIVILANTVMGKGVKEAEGTHNYHGQPVKDFAAAVSDLGVEDELDYYRKLRESDATTGFEGRPKIKPNVNVPDRIVYQFVDQLDCRSAWGQALVDIGRANINSDGTPKEGYSPIAVFDCDLAGSVKTSAFEKRFPNNFFQGGIQEHSTAMTAGAVSTRGVLSWLADFGVFGHGMTYNEHMLTAMNDGNLKLVTTHNSIDVGEDSKTHSPVDYLKLANLPGWQTFCFADPNQTDAGIRYMAANYGNMHAPMGRSKVPVITKQGTDEPFFDGNYKFNPKKFDMLRNYGNEAVIVTYGTPTWRAVNAAEMLNEQGIGIKVINVSTPKEIPDGLAEIASGAKMIVTFEDHNVETGIKKELDSALDDYNVIAGVAPKYKKANVGMRSYSRSAPSEQLYNHFGIHEGHLVELITADIQKRNKA